MKIYFAGIESQRKIIERCKPKNVLFSFASANEQSIKYALSSNCESFLLDSGAFTFLNTAKRVDFDSYVDRYIEFINHYSIPLFFEMDIDSIVGIQKVEEYRARIERFTGKQAIPVWHKSRGKQYFESMTKDYKYIAIGGIVTKEIKRSEHGYFKWFIDKAHENGCKIHGLGHTNMADVFEYRFDTVDSTTWINGGRFGNMITFRDGIPKQTTLRKQGYKVNGEKLTEHNLRQFMKFADYAEKYL